MMTKGRYGIHGGQYIPETLMHAVIELEKAYEYYKMTRSLTKNCRNFFMNTPTAHRFCIMQKR